jgi:TetR/AcrR family transcriptional regulator of autoinduction and epiphytic fitness
VKGTRPYRSPKREEQSSRTRRQILDAAIDQFRTHGYAGTTIKAIASAAGVSVPAIELAFSTKAVLLKEAIDVVIAGDDEPVPVLDRPWATQLQAATTARAFVAGVAQVLAASSQRAAALVLAAFEATRADQRLAPLAAQLKTQRATTAAWIVDGIAVRAPLRIDQAQAIDTVWLLMDPAVFDRLTADRGWTAQQYAAWFADTALRLLTES